MYWENIEGWFTFQLLYSNMIQRFPNCHDGFVSNDKTYIEEWCKNNV